LFFEAIERAEPDMLHPWTRRGGLFRGTEWGWPWVWLYNHEGEW